MQSNVLPTVLLVAVIVALFTYGWRQRDRAAPIASLLVSIGIFGTFLGIAYALFGFDTEAVDESVPSLLSGMRLAFITSVAGIFFAVLLRARAIIRDDGGVPDGDFDSEAAVTPAEALAVRAEQHQELLDQLAAIRRALASAEDGSVVTQLRLAREELARHVLGMQQEVGELSARVTARGDDDPRAPTPDGDSRGQPGGHGSPGHGTGSAAGGAPPFERDGT